MKELGFWGYRAKEIGSLILAAFALLLLASNSLGYSFEDDQLYFRPGRAISLGFRIATAITDAIVETANETTLEP